jgi:hypothetical protein
MAFDSLSEKLQIYLRSSEARDVFLLMMLRQL